MSCFNVKADLSEKLSSGSNTSKAMTLSSPATVADRNPIEKLATLVLSVAGGSEEGIGIVSSPAGPRNFCTTALTRSDALSPISVESRSKSMMPITELEPQSNIPGGTGAGAGAGGRGAIRGCAMVLAVCSS